MMKRREFKVYRFKTINKTIIYVGYTGKATLDRFFEHTKDKYWIHEVSEVEECIIENEAQARLVEMHYINSLKPIFNMKDKFAGAIQSKLRPKDKKFTHSFFVINGVPTTCATKTNDDHTLVNFISLKDYHIGMYYDSFLNLYYSATDMCKALNISNKELKRLANNNNSFIQTSYNTMNKGKEVINTLYLCTYDAIRDIIALSNSELANLCKSKLSISRRSGDISIMFPNEEEALSIKILYDNNLQHLSGDRYNDSDIKRRLVFRSFNCNKSINNVVEEYNKSMATYDIKFPAEVLACDIFSMVEDLSNEYGSSYKDVFSDFNDYLVENHDMNFWQYNSSTKKRFNDNTLQSHFIVALNKEVLYDAFVEFYENSLNALF